MALIYDGLQNLVGNNLPNISIDSIQLSIGTDPEPESNPHINSNREYVRTGISGNKLVQNAMPSITQQQTQNKNFFLDISLSSTKTKDQNTSLVFGKTNFLDFVYVKVIQSLSSDLTAELIANNFPTDYTKLKNIASYSERLFKLSDFYLMAPTVTENNNIKISKYTNKIRFTSKNPEKEHLDVFAFAYLDVDELISTFELNMTNDFDVKGNITKERVIEKSKTNNKAYTLTDQNNNIFIGTPIKGKNGKFYATKPTSSAQEATLRPLNLVTTTNKKIIDSRNMSEIDTETVISREIVPQVGSSSISREIPSIIPQQQSFLSQLYLSRQKNNTYSSLFVFDIISYLKKNSSTPEIYNDEESHNYIKIKKISIIRKRVKTVDSVVYPFSEYTPDKTLITTSETSFGNIVNKFSFIDGYGKMYTTSINDLTNGNFGSTLPTFATVETLKKIASITEINVSNAKGFRTFTFTDYEISTLSTGEYRYGIEIEVEDRIGELNQKRVDNLYKARTKTLAYLSEAERSDMFSMAENRQNDKFIATQNTKYKTLNLKSVIQAGAINQALTIQHAPWIEVPSLLSDTKRQINKEANVSEMVEQYYNLLNPTTTSPTSISSIVSKIDSTIANIRKIYSLDEKQDKSSLSYKSSVLKSRLITHTFSNVINSDIRKVGIDYLNVATAQDLSANSIGLSKVAKSVFDLRINTEMNKYFPSTSNITAFNTAGSFSSDELASLGDITSYSSCYFSPAIAIVDGKEIKLDTTDISNTNPEKYDMIINKSVSTNNVADKSVNNELSTKTNLSLSTVEDFSSNLTTTIQLSFIAKPSLLSDASNIFDNDGFNTATNSFTLNDFCKTSNGEGKNENMLLKMVSLTNFLLDDIIRPTAKNDTFNDVTSINTIDKFSITSNTSILNTAKEKTITTTMVTTSAIQSTSGSSTISIATPIVVNSLAAIPLQTKSLMLSTVTPTKFKLSSIGFDPFLHPDTKNFMRLNFQNICQTEYLAGFEKGNINLPIWSLLNKQAYDSLEGQIVIRTKQYTNKLFNIGTETGFNYDTYNEFSILEKEEITPSVSVSKPRNILPNININVGNSTVSVNNIYSSLNITAGSVTQTELTKQLIVANTIDAEIKPSYTYSKLELDNAN